MTLFQGIFTAPSWHTFTYLAGGWALAGDRHTITTYLWLTGAATVKHFSRFYVFLGCPLYNKRWQLWGAVIRLAAQCVPEGEVIRVSFDDTTKKKAGTHIEGLACYRNGAGSARQEYRTLRGVNFVLGLMRIPLNRWPGYSLSVQWVWNCISNPCKPKNSTSRIVPEVSWPVISSISWPSSYPHVACTQQLMGAMAQRTMSGACPMRLML